MPSFDTVLKADAVELRNAVEQTNKEITGRFDFKGSDARVEQKEFELTAFADSEFQLEQVLDVLRNKCAKRNVDVRFLVEKDVQKMGGDKVKQVIQVKNGVATDDAKKIVKLIKDSKIKVQASIQGDAVRVLAVTMADSGKIQIAKLAKWGEPVKKKDNVVVVTDTPAIFSHWSQAFREEEHMKDLIRTYLECRRSGLVRIDDAIKMFDPMDVVQTAKMDERGQAQEFDESITNGHMAVLLAIWAARRAYGGHVLTEVSESDEQYDDGEDRAKDDQGGCAALPSDAHGMDSGEVRRKYNCSVAVNR